MIQKLLTTSTHQVPCRWVEHIGDQNTKHDTAHIVEVPSEDNGLLSKSCGWHLGNKTVADRADCEVVDPGEDKDHGAGCPRYRDIRVF